LNKSTHSRVANSTSSTPHHGLRAQMASVSYSPITDSSRALSYDSPTVPTEGSMSASASRSVVRGQATAFFPRFAERGRTRRPPDFPASLDEGDRRLWPGASISANVARAHNATESSADDRLRARGLRTQACGS
jgi:hypothetical protein